MTKISKNFKNLNDALSKAIQIAIELQTKKLAIPKRYLSDMREIWMMQPRFEKKQPRIINSLLNHPKLRAGYDFLLLRCQSGEIDSATGIWWKKLIEADSTEKGEIIMALSKSKKETSRRKKYTTVNNDTHIS